MEQSAESCGAMSVKIAFWSLEAEAATTTNMLLLAWMYAGKKPEQSILVNTGQKWNCIYHAGTERILFADCGNRKDEKTYRSLRNADVIVVNLNPEQPAQNLLFLKQNYLVSNCVFLIGKFRGEPAGEQKKLEQIHRLDTAGVGWIPYNGELEYAMLHGNIMKFISKYRNGETEQRNRCLFRELERNLFLLRKQLEQRKN